MAESPGPTAPSNVTIGQSVLQQVQWHWKEMSRKFHLPSRPAFLRMSECCISCINYMYIFTYTYICMLDRMNTLQLERYTYPDCCTQSCNRSAAACNAKANGKGDGDNSNKERSFHIFAYCFQEVHFAFRCVENPRWRVRGWPRQKLPTAYFFSTPFPSLSSPSVCTCFFKYLASYAIWQHFDSLSCWLWCWQPGPLLFHLIAVSTRQLHRHPSWLWHANQMACHHVLSRI